MIRGAISPERYVQLARAALWSLTIIVISGAAVRLTGSGLGCSDWPACEDDQFVASLEYHALIEFGNRLFTGVVTIAVVLAVLGSIRRAPKRRDLVWWSWGLVAGVVAQILLGAVLVLTHLDPRFTMGHFLLSMVLLWNAAVLLEKARTDVADAEPLWMGEPSEHDGAIRSAARTLFAFGAVLLVTGTVVTGSGPHSGSDDELVAERLPFLVRDVTRIHSVTAFTVLAVVLLIVRRAHVAGKYELREQTARVMTLLVAQGAVGYWQYFTGVPVWLVAVHITLASVTWIQIVRLAWQAEQVPARDRVLV
ncbi:MAG: COX15/CtaA family protein [Actinomycetota bacterium]